MSGRVAVLILSLTLTLGACGGENLTEAPLDEGTPDDSLPDGPATRDVDGAVFVVSNPVAVAQTGAASVHGRADDRVVWVSLPPGSFPQATAAVVEHPRAGTSTTPVLREGGFDPVPIAAAEDDTLVILLTTPGHLLRAFVPVPRRKPPIVVRTDPPKRKLDVPLNAVLHIVFSEPVAAPSLDAASLAIRLGGTVVPAALVSGGTSVLVTPTASLQLATTYELHITTAVRDLDGDSLTATEVVPFTTVASPEGALGFREVAVGDWFSCAIALDGQTYCWGHNSYETLGMPSTDACWLAVDGRPECNLAAGPIRSTRTFTELQGGFLSRCGLDGTWYCWGRGGDGVIGHGDTTSARDPMPAFGGVPITTLALKWHACGLDADGVAYCWGWNIAGQLGLGFAANSHLTEPQPVATSLRFRTIATGWYHTCAVATDDQTYCWGMAAAGQLGNDSGGAGVPPALAPVQVVGNRQFVSIQAGNDFTCGLTAGGVAYCWGGNTRGQLGDGLTGWRPRPAPVSGSHAFVQLQAGDRFACGRTGAGAVWCWGSNQAGRLGTDDVGFTVNDFVPVPGLVGEGRTFTDISLGQSHACAIGAADAWVYCWGRNLAGQIGDGMLGAYLDGAFRVVPTPIVVR